MTARLPILELNDLSFGHDGQPPLWAHCSFSIPAGISQIFGDTGSGKSTLLRVIAGVLPAEGRITFDDSAPDQVAAGRERITLERDSSVAHRAAYRRKVFFIDTATDAFDAMTARQCADVLVAGNVLFDEVEWRMLIEGFGLGPHLGKPLYMLSTGSKRKVWLATALASRHPLTLLDEPTAGLDAASISCLFRALAAVAEAGDRAIVIASAERIERIRLDATIDLPFA